MRWWPWQQRRPAARASTYTAAVLAAQEFHAAGGGAAATAALETAAAMVSRALGTAEVMPRESPAAMVCGPAVLQLIGRSLVRNGEFVAAIDVDGQGRVSMLPAGDWDVLSGGPRQGSWVYRLSADGPHQTWTRTLPASGVVHVRWQADADQRWWGIAPLASASHTGALAGWLEQRLGEEASSPAGGLIASPHPPDDPDDADSDTDDPTSLAVGTYTKLRRQLASLKGGFAIVEARQRDEDGDWQSHRFGANPPAVLAQLRGQVFDTVLAACGVPPPLAVAGSDGASRREAYRQFLHGTVEPVGRLIAEELAAKLDAPGCKLSFAALAATDLAARTRLFKSLVVEGGKTTDEALAMSGIMLAED